jgi:hypothetical protein
MGRMAPGEVSGWPGCYGVVGARRGSKSRDHGCRRIVDVDHGPVGRRAYDRSHPSLQHADDVLGMGTGGPVEATEAEHHAGPAFVGEPLGLPLGVADRAGHGRRVEWCALVDPDGALVGVGEGQGLLNVTRDVTGQGPVYQVAGHVPADPVVLRPRRSTQGAAQGRDPGGQVHHGAGVLVAQGGRFGGWTLYAIELNLRKGGTTHPFLTLQFLTDGAYDPERAVFTAPSGREKFFVASDHVESPQYRGLTPDDLFDMVVRRGLHFDQSRQTGVVFHMMSALPEHGRVGLTAVADSHSEAQELYERTIATLDEETQSVH